MEKVKIKALNSANLRMDNSVDTDREYEISANANIDSTNTVVSIENGSVMKEGMEIASFSSYGEDNLSINYNNVKQEEHCTIINAVNSFIGNVRLKASASVMASILKTI